MYTGYVLIGSLNLVHQLSYHILKVGMASYAYFTVCKIVHDRWSVPREKIAGNSRFGKLSTAKIPCRYHPPNVTMAYYLE